MSPRCLVRGSLNIDEVFSLPHIVRPGETISSTGLTKKAGGKGANQAYACALAGGGVDLEGFIGPDGVWVKEMLQNGGVGVGRLGVVEGEVTGRAVIQKANDGENSIVLHKGANFHTPSSSTTSPDLKSYTHLLIQNEIPLPTTLSYLQSSSSSELTTVFNPSPMLSPPELLSFPWAQLSWLIVNEGELTDLLDAFSLSSSTEPDLKVKAKKEILSLHNCPSFSKKTGVICTLGSQGILYFHPQVEDGQVGYLKAGKLENPVKDTTGAGDCFAGWFVAGLMGGMSVKESLERCLVACAMCVEKEGAMESYPTVSQVKERQARYQ